MNTYPIFELISRKTKTDVQMIIQNIILYIPDKANNNLIAFMLKHIYSLVTLNYCNVCFLGKEDKYTTASVVLHVC